MNTPLGRRGIFWEIATEELRKYPHHRRQEVPWWLCRFFSNDIERAAVEAPLLPTEERVARFGRPTIVEQYDSLPLEDFQQELECRFVDESYSFYSYDLILPNTRDGLDLCDDFTDLPFPEGRLVAGFDVGRSYDRSELALFEEVGGRFVCRLLGSYDRVPFAEQEADLSRMLNPNFSKRLRRGPLRSRDSRPSRAVLAFARTSRTVKYACALSKAPCGPI